MKLIFIKKGNFEELAGDSIILKTEKKLSFENSAVITLPFDVSDSSVSMDFSLPEVLARTGNLLLTGAYYDSDSKEIRAHLLNLNDKDAFKLKKDTPLLLVKFYEKVNFRTIPKS